MNIIGDFSVIILKQLQHHPVCSDASTSRLNRVVLSFNSRKE